MRATLILVGEVHGFDKVAPLLAQGVGAGRVLGARVRAATSCEVELLMLSRVDDGYRLRNVTVSLDRLDAVRNHLFEDTPSENLGAEDVRFSLLEDALGSAQTLAETSRTEPIRGREQWLPDFQFVASLTRSHLRSDIPWLPQPPRWWEVTKKGLGVAAFMAVLGLPVLLSWALINPFVGGDWESPENVWAWVLAIVLFLAIGFGLIGLVNLSEPFLDVIERRLERPSDTLRPVTGDDVEEDEVAEKSADDIWDFELWSGPEQVLVVLVALAAPLALLFFMDDHLSEAWADWLAVPIIGIGDLVAAGLFVLIYGTGRAWLRRHLKRS